MPALRSLLPSFKKLLNIAVVVAVKASRWIAQSHFTFARNKSYHLSLLQETREYFSKTKVVAAIVPREGGTEDSVTQKFTKGNMFTHHQKSVNVDGQDPQ